MHEEYFPHCNLDGGGASVSMAQERPDTDVGGIRDFRGSAVEPNEVP